MAVPRRYEIRLFDRPLVEFAVSDGLMGPDIELSDYDSTALPLMPCGLSLTPEGIRTWLEIRSIPTNRRNAARICRELGFKLGDLEALFEALDAAIAKRAPASDGAFRLAPGNVDLN